MPEGESRPLLIERPIVVRTYAPGTRAQHDLDARLPFSDDEPGPARRARE